jgi:hypothetical protein
MNQRRTISRKGRGRHFTRKTHSLDEPNQPKNTNTIQTFGREIVLKYLSFLNMVKLYHWKTHSYATHEATDSLYKDLNEKIDQFVEVMMGKFGIRVDLTDVKTLELRDFNDVAPFLEEINEFKSYLVSLNDNPGMNTMKNYDLITIRDEILADLNQFLYLLTFTK